MNKLNGRIVTPNAPQNALQSAPQSALQKRLEAVAAMILANGSIAISVIAQNLNVSRDSIKRDLKKLGYAWEGASKKWSLGSQIAVLTVVRQKTIFSIKFSPT
jgi:ATP-dependent DNA helicase RecG